MALTRPPDGRARPTEAAPEDAAEAAVLLATRVALGATAIAARALAEAAGPRAWRVLPGPPGYGLDVAVGLGLAAERRLLSTIGLFLEPAARAAWFARGWLDPWYRRGRQEQRRNRELAERALRLAAARTLAAVLRQLDVNAIVERVDLARIVDRLELDEIVRRVDVNAVAERVDLARIVDRLDFDAIVERVDLPRRTREVLEEADIDAVIRDSTHSLTGESVDALRLQGMNADQAVSRIVDRILSRRRRR